MAKTFHLTIATVGENLFDGEAVSVVLPGEEGIFTVMANHEPFVTPLVEGMARVETAEGKVETFPLTRGVAEVSGNQATVLM